MLGFRQNQRGLSFHLMFARILAIFNYSTQPVVTIKAANHARGGTSVGDLIALARTHILSISIQECVKTAVSIADGKHQARILEV
ncbi:hypothetical protein HBI56_059160 [Parastagonospora nodorum]|nr:hypothetical protein HBH56_159480 [Parastagonospora nodorum]KAH3922381.1 hypothetical protein HBH54_223910 [Parastagonospora nodorum]KAH3947101.1 hypothetical protein HBH53_122440 [Parastagonospora nodorum]KAH3969720.1 hypothetical protein HBH52_170460 [Parastagonospora nodorum]KAH4002273.1 hypothetical protein HBI10_072000 [Parastagonospora nodorum]